MLFNQIAKIIEERAKELGDANDSFQQWLLEFMMGYQDEPEKAMDILIYCHKSQLI